MELVDRYLKAVGSYLPEEQKDDIVKELSENIRSEMEDKEAEFGRPLSAAEQEAILKQHGHPLLVAGRYREDQRSLAFGRQWIGPVLFPFYLKVLSFNLGFTFTVVFIILAALFASGQPITFSDLASVFFLQFIIQFAIITMIFAVADTHFRKYPDRWDPKKPQQLKYPDFLTAPAAKDARRVPRGESICQIVASAVFLVWLRAAQQSPFLIFGPAAGIFRLAPVWHQVFAPSLFIIMAGMVQAGVNLLRPDWIRFRSAGRAAMGAITLVVVYFLVRAQEWVLLTNPAADASGVHRHAMEIVNQAVFYSLLLAGLIVILLLVRDLWSLIRAERERPASRA